MAAVKAPRHRAMLASFVDGQFARGCGARALDIGVFGRGLLDVPAERTRGDDSVVTFLELYCLPGRHACVPTQLRECGAAPVGIVGPRLGAAGESPSVGLVFDLAAENGHSPEISQGKTATRPLTRWKTSGSSRYMVVCDGRMLQYWHGIRFQSWAAGEVAAGDASAREGA
jgi:hypothetical protein